MSVNTGGKLTAKWLDFFRGQTQSERRKATEMTLESVAQRNRGVCFNQVAKNENMLPAWFHQRYLVTLLSELRQKHRGLVKLNQRAFRLMSQLLMMHESKQDSE